ncbi:MAG: helix-turn-helix domain containing protein [Bacilli bacterium]|nr:helix-turn-helix domain containing protein [Bacilli bacterium]
MKFTFDDKLKAVLYYLKYGSYEIPDDYASPNQKCRYRSIVRHWVSVYRLKGEEGLRHGNNHYYSPEKKYQIIEPLLNGEIGLETQANIVGIDHGTLSSWVKRYREKGMDGLKCSKRGRPCKNMEPENQEAKAPAEPIRPTEDEPQTLEEALLENRRLKEKLLYKEARELYLKKLDALVEERERQERLKKHARLRKSSKARKSK